MTDRDLLRMCIEAFEAIPIAAEARKMLKNLDRRPVSYAGNGSHILCREMIEIIKNRIGN